ncbi:MAG: heat-inducible transcription repressor HrcA [Proteobacteria bacterium]|nr:heat-inducible transcription repressor HrcA [Pseudomonadota bacterium]
MKVQSGQINERAGKVLNHIIQNYVSTGQPVGSTTLARAPDLQVSSATVRNVMSDLEELGLIHSPHTSAGRIPTSAGYRTYINQLLHAQPLHCDQSSEIERALQQYEDPKKLLTNASQMLSRLTSFAGVVSMPDSEFSHFKQIEFLKLKKERVLAILVTKDGMVENKVLNLDQEYSDSELVRASNYFNDAYAGRSMFEVRQDLLRKMEQDSSEMRGAMQTAVEMAQSLLNEHEEDDEVVVSGRSNLFGLPDFSETEQLKGVLDTFHTKRVLLDLVSKSLSGEGISIYIGEESGYQALEACSVIAMPYEKEGQRVGVLGVIGPTRMAYDQVVAVVDVTSKLLSSALSD